MTRTSTPCPPIMACASPHGEEQNSFSVTGQQRIVAGLAAWPEQQQPSQGLPGLQGQATLGGRGGAETCLNSRLMYGILERGQSFFGAFSGAGSSPRDTPTTRADKSRAA